VKIGSGFTLDRAGVALLILAATMLAGAGAMGLFDTTETRFAEIAREMRVTGDYLVPRLNGVPHFHKPPLAYWATAAGLAAFGDNAWGARVPAILGSILTLAFAALAVRRRFGVLGFTPGAASWVLGTALLFAVVGRSVASDPYLAMSVAGFWALAPSPAALALLGIGFLAKGPVVLALTALPVLAAALAGREGTSLRLLGPGWGWLLCAAIALPWYLVVVARTPGLLSYFLEAQLWKRYTTTVYHRGGPAWYFLAVLAAGMAPWSAALVAGLGRAWRERARPEARLLAAWLVVPLIFFSFSGSKLPAYLLPCVPAAAMLAAWGLAPAGRATRIATALLLVALAAAGWIAGPAALGRLVGLRPVVPVSLPFAAHVALACLLYAATWALRGRAARAAVLVALAWTAFGVALAPLDAALGSPRQLARVLEENRAADEPVIEFARFNAGLPFYLRRQVPMLDVPPEVEFDQAFADSSALLRRGDLATLAARHARVWVLGPPEATAALAQELDLRYTAIVRWRHTALGFLAR